MKKYIVVTGGCGFVGTNLIRHLLKKKLVLPLLVLTIIHQEQKEII